MKSLNQYIKEKLIINKDYRDNTIVVKTFDELRKIIEDRYKKLGRGTKQKPIDFNDVDVSNIDSFYDKNNDRGIFDETKFKYIDVSYWDVSNCENINSMFFACEQLKSVGDLSNWNVSKVEDMHHMFYECAQLKSVGDLSNWNVSNVKYVTSMFQECEQLTSVGDLSNWNVSKVKDMGFIFSNCLNLNSVFLFIKFCNSTICKKSL